MPTGIDTATFAPLSRAVARRELGLPDAVPLAGIVATLRSWKGHRYLVDAMPLLRHRDVRLVVVGDGPQRAALEAQVAQLGLRERVLFAGQRIDVARWLASFDVFVLPSYANEGVPQALLQAMLACIPCVTTDAGAIAEIARDGDTARIVPRENAAALAAAIDAVLDDPAGSAAIAERARAFVLPLSWKSALIPYLAKIPRRVGYKGEARYVLLNDLRRLDAKALPRLVDRFGALAGPPGTRVPMPPAPVLVPDTANRDAAIRQLRLKGEGPVAVLCPGAEYGPAKRWPPTHFADLSRRLLEMGARVWIVEQHAQRDGSPRRAPHLAALSGAKGRETRRSKSAFQNDENLQQMRAQPRWRNASWISARRS